MESDESFWNRIIFMAQIKMVLEKTLQHHFILYKSF